MNLGLAVLNFIGYKLTDKQSNKLCIHELIFLVKKGIEGRKQRPTK